MFLQRSDDNTGKIEGIVDEKLAMSGFVNEEQVTEMIAAAQLEPVVPDVYLTKNEAASTYSTTGHSHSSFNNRLSTTGLDAKNGITSFTFGNDYLGINTYHDTMGGVFVDQYERDGTTRRNRVTIINGYGYTEFPGNTAVLKDFTAKQNVNIYGDLYVKGVKIDGSGGGEFDPSVLEPYATIQYVDSEIAKIPSGGGGGDVTKAYVDEQISTHNHNNVYYTKSEVDTKIAEIPSGGGGGVDPSQFALKDHTHTYIGNDIRVDGNITMKTGETKSWDLAFDWLTVATIPRQMVRDVKDSNIITLGTRQQYKVERGDRLKASFTFDNLSTTNTITIDYTFSNSEGGGVKTTIYENVLWTGDGVGYTMTFDNLPYNSDGKIYVTCSQLEIYREKTTENITTLVSANGDATLPGSLTATNKYHQMGNLSIDEDVFRFFNADMKDQDKCYFEIGKGLNKTTGNEGFWITYTFPGITELGFQGAIDMMKFTYDGRKIDINGDLTVAGEININKIKASNVTVNGGALYFLNMNTGDWVGRIAECSIVGGSKEVIHLMVEHYEHRMTLLDENGDTTLPGSLTVSGDLNVPNIATVGSLMMSNEDSGRNVRLYCSDVGIGVYDSKKGKYYTLWNANNVSETITHTTNVTGEIGTFCETNGGIYDGYDNITETDCICQVVQSSTLNNRIVGVITSPNQFASHGDVLMKVVPGTYKLGDILAPDITGRARVATDTELQYMVIHAIPRPKITSLATGIENTVACFIV